MEINQETKEKLQALAKAYTKIINKIFECMNRFIKWAQENWEWIKVKWVKYYQLVEKKEKVYKDKHFMNFSREKIMHQVIDRRPKQMIRKIIR